MWYSDREYIRERVICERAWNAAQLSLQVLVLRRADDVHAVEQVVGGVGGLLGRRQHHRVPETDTEPRVRDPRRMAVVAGNAIIISMDKHSDARRALDHAVHVQAIKVRRQGLHNKTNEQRH